MNIERMKKLIGQLERLPDERFWMADWVMHPEDIEYYMENGCIHPILAERFKEAQCETVACIAGWAALANGLIPDDPKARSSGYDIAMEARRWLELSHDEAHALFYGEWSDGDASKITRTDAINYMRQMVADAEHTEAHRAEMWTS